MGVTLEKETGLPFKRQYVHAHILKHVSLPYLSEGTLIWIDILLFRVLCCLGF